MSFACERSGSEQRLVSMPYDVYQRCRPLTILFGITYCTLSLLSCMTAAAFFGGGAHAGHSHFWVNFYFTQFILFALASLVMVYRTPVIRGGPNCDSRARVVLRGLRYGCH